MLFFAFINASFRPKKRIVWSTSVAVVAGILMISFGTVAGAADDTLQIAVIGPMSGKDLEGGQAMLDGVNLFIEETNKQGGINGRKLTVIVRDDQNNRDLARKWAKEVAENTDALVVIGHYYSSVSLEGGKIYKEYGIPALTASATAPEVTEGNDWYFRVVPNTALQGKFSAIYADRVLKQDTVSVVFERDSYGFALQRSFVQAARDLGLRVRKIWDINSKTDNVDRIFEAIVKELQLDSKPGALFVALQDHEAARLIRLIRDVGLDLTIIGGDTVGSESFPRKFRSITLEAKSPGYYTDGIYAATFFIRDIGNRRARQFNSAFKRRFGREPDNMAATHYDAAALAVEAIRGTKIKANLNRSRENIRTIEAIRQAKIEADLNRSRENIRDRLKTFRSIETAYDGITGRIFFDEQGNAVKPFPIGLYLHDRLISAPIQLCSILNPKVIVNMDKELEAGNIITMDDRFMFRTMVVYTGIDINEISNINPREETFTADFYLWFRQSGDLDYSQIEFMNAMGSVTLTDEPIMEKSDQNMTHRAYRIKGTFKESFSFRDYPFDSQTLRISLRHKKLNSERLLFVSDDIGMQRDGNRTPVERLIEHSGLGDEEQWHLRDVLVFSDIGITDSTLGNPAMFHSKADTAINYSRFNIVTEIERNAKSYVLKNLIPLFIVIVLGYAMFYVSPQGPPFVARMNLGVTALLTAVFLSINAANQIPNIGYLVALDYMYYAVYILVLSGITLTVAKHRAIRNRRKDLVQRLDFWGRVFQPLYIIAGIAILAYLY